MTHWLLHARGDTISGPYMHLTRVVFSRLPEHLAPQNAYASSLAVLCYLNINMPGIRHIWYPPLARRPPSFSQPQCTCSGDRCRMRLKDSRQQVVDDLVLALLPGLLDLGDLHVGLLASLLLGLLVAVGVLSGVSITPALPFGTGEPCTSASNALYSASLLARYVSISFLASSRASLTRLVRSARCQSLLRIRECWGEAYTLELCPAHVSVESRVIRRWSTYTSGRSWMPPSRPASFPSATISPVPR